VFVGICGGTAAAAFAEAPRRRAGRSIAAIAVRRRRAVRSGRTPCQGCFLYFDLVCKIDFLFIWFVVTQAMFVQ